MHEHNFNSLVHQGHLKWHGYQTWQKRHAETHMHGRRVEPAVSYPLELLQPRLPHCLL